MTLSPGARLGSYEILRPLAAGGMGEVYRARDARLGREVALKVLPERFAEDRAARERFEREARAVAALSHPNILAIHDVGLDGGVAFAVLELLDGETLRERLAAGPIPPRKAAGVAAQVARGLAAAHDKGIVHRDLKPENVFVTRDGQVKILDFGLARQHGPLPESGDVADSPTVGVSTDPGTLLGTVGYMAPEQVRGEVVDGRADLFSLGCVLYEMLSGRRAFERPSAAETLSAILRDEPRPLENVPPHLERLVHRCLEKRRAERFQSARDLAFDLETVTDSSASLARAGETAAGRAPLARTLRGLIFPAAVALVALAIGYGLAAWTAKPPASRGPVRLLLEAPDGTTFHDAPSISPDGTKVAFLAADGGGKVRLYVRPLATGAATVLAEVPDVLDAISSQPFWSPDNEAVAFCDGAKIRIERLAGGAAEILADCTPTFRGGNWGGEDTILFAPDSNSPIFVVTPGATPRAVTTIDPNVPDLSHRYPRFLADGRRFLYLGWSNAAEAPADAVGIFLADLAGTQPRKVSDHRGNAAVVQGANSQHWLLLPRDLKLSALPLDTGTMTTRAGEEVVEADLLSFASAAYGYYSANGAGDVASLASFGIPAASLNITNRDGTVQESLALRNAYLELAVSPDERKVATVVYDPRHDSDAWVIDLERRVATRLTTGPVSRFGVAWHPDSRTIGFSSEQTGTYQPYALAADGSGSEQLLAPTAHYDILESWSIDGRWIVLNRGQSAFFGDRNPLDRRVAQPLRTTNPGRSRLLHTELWARSLVDGREVPICQSTGLCADAAMSPDGRHVAYVADFSSRAEVYVRPFLGAGGQFQVSSAGGRDPHWRSDGRELVYRDEEGWVVAAQVSAGADFSAAAPQRLFFMDPRAIVAPYPDHQRFLIGSPYAGGSTRYARLILDWR